MGGGGRSALLSLLVTLVFVSAVQAGTAICGSTWNTNGTEWWSFSGQLAYSGSNNGMGDSHYDWSGSTAAQLTINPDGPTYQGCRIYYRAAIILNNSSPPVWESCQQSAMDSVDLLGSSVTYYFDPSPDTKDVTGFHTMQYKVQTTCDDQDPDLIVPSIAYLSNNEP